MNRSHTQRTKPKTIAIIGSGVSGLTCAHYLVGEHDITIFEANDYLGGHVNTIDVTLKTPRKFRKDSIETSSIDTGFIVFNERTYPNFFRLLDELGVPFQKTDMSFSVQNPAIHFEYNGHTLNSLLSQRKNVISPKFWRFAKDIITFNKDIKQLYQDYKDLDQEIKSLTLSTEEAKQNCKFTNIKSQKLKRKIASKTKQLKHLRQETLYDYLSKHKYGKLFQENYLLPMVSSIWSMKIGTSKSLPLIFFAQFFVHHGLLDIVNRPRWFTIKGGSKQYVNKLVNRYAKLGGKALVNSPVQSVTRHSANLDTNSGAGVTIIYKDIYGNDKSSAFDAVIFACHADVTKALLSDINELESKVLGSFTFSDNEAILHTDTSVLPKKTLTWASWNYLLPNVAETSYQDLKPFLTYNMNILQRLVKKHNYLVTLNKQVDDAHVIKRINYRHPVYDVEMTLAQQQWLSLTAQDNHTHFCGAYWFSGFHEDGVKSGLRVCQHLGADINILVKVNPYHLTHIDEPNPIFKRGALPVKADKNAYTISKREVFSASTNTALNALFE